MKKTKSVFKSSPVRYLEQLFKNNSAETFDLLNQIIANEPIGFALFDKNLRYRLVNKFLAEINGASVENHLGKTTQGIIPSMAEAAMKKMRQVLKTGKPVLDVELKGNKRLHSEETQYRRVSYFPTRSSSGGVVGVGALVTDITKQKRTEEILRKTIDSLKMSEKRFRAVAETANDAIISVNSRGKIIFWNDSAKEMFGYSVREAVGKSLSLIVPQRFYQRHKQGLRRVITTGNTKLTGKTVEMEARKKDGSEFPVELSLAKWETNGNIYFTGIIRDITGHKKKDEALRSSEMRYRQLVDRNFVGIILADREKIVDANNAFLKMIGYTRADLVRGKIKWPEMTPPEYNFLDQKALKELKDTGMVVPFEKEYIRKDGSHIPILIGVTLLRRDPLQFVGVILNITRRKETEKALRESEERYSLAQRAANIGSWDWNILTGELKWSEQIEPLFGFKSGEFEKTYSAFLECVHPDDRQAVIESVNSCVREGKEYKIEHRIIWPSGLTKWVLETGNVERDTRGRAIRMLGIVQDVTERKELEQRKDEFISIASHELKTPLTSVKIFTQILKKMFQEKEERQVTAYLNRMDAQLDKLTQLINDLLDVSKIQAGRLDLRPENFSLKTLIGETAQEVQVLNEKHRIIVYGSEDREIYADKNRLEQVIINLLSNAIKYSPKAKRVIVKIQADEEEIKVGVKDYGVGIAKEHFEKIFFPFYSINNEKIVTNRGLGMGLYIANEIIKYHNGRMWVESVVGKGSTFYFSLPLRPN